MATGTTPFTRGVDGSNSFTYSLTLPNGYTVLKKHPEFQVTGKRGHRMVRLRKGA